MSLSYSGALINVVNDANKNKHGLNVRFIFYSVQLSVFCKTSLTLPAIPEGGKCGPDHVPS